MKITIHEVAQYIEKVGGKIIDVAVGYDAEFSNEDFKDLPHKKYVLPFVLFSGNRDTFLKIGEKSTEFNRSSKDNEKFIYWKVIVFEWNKENSEYCLSATTNRMDLHDPSVVTGLTIEKRSELLRQSEILLNDFLDYLKKQNAN